MKVQELINFWYSHRCPYCDRLNWTYHSHSQRYYTGIYLNTNACKCFSCNKTYWLGEPDEFEEPTVQDGNPSNEIK